jgi:hypothetical protein
MKELRKIIKRLQSNDYPECTWVGGNYNKLQLIQDLERVDSLIGKAPECDSGSCQFNSDSSLHGV